MISTSMAVLGAAAIGGVASLASGALGAGAADKAAQTQAGAADQALAYQKQTDAQNLALSMPWIEAGKKALAQYYGELTGEGTPASPGTTQGGYGPASGGQSFNSVYEWTQAGSPSDAMVHVNGTVWQPASTLSPTTGGAAVNTPATPATPFQSQFQKTPGYEFQVSEGEKGVNNNLAALGMKNSGAALKALTRFRQGLADTTYENYLTRLSNLATGGQQQVSNTTNMLQNSAINQGQTIQDAAAARASGYVGGANSWINALTNIGNTGSNALGWLSGSNKLKNKNVYA